jgi:DNA-binding response OmpR family regulator
MLREKILLVDDEPALAPYLEEVVREEGFARAERQLRRMEALPRLKRKRFYLVITDLAHAGDGRSGAACAEVKRA